MRRVFQGGGEVYGCIRSQQDGGPRRRLRVRCHKLLVARMDAAQDTVPDLLKKNAGVYQSPSCPPIGH